ncbi:NADH dehydrogenase [ubiquinone] flavoprotein 3, mitochondrial isoform X1 [Pseudophryne corroboree]|uniref:NADH dehydrogenase [ubiquinone] flavoprotein 3, mitochondrial isoform X1 n=1 Tax=Pseudophryne corroboree TaxID=495146 RepID=UPI003081A1B1
MAPPWCCSPSSGRLVSLHTELRVRMAAPALRPVRRLRLEAFLLPRISVTPVRAINGGEGSSQTGICKTLVSFPVKFSNFQDSTTVSPPGPLAAPVPEEPFDNSKYQNEQHFSYTPFTFVDYDVELAKFRLPQPSSGRPSPQH